MRPTIGRIVHLNTVTTPQPAIIQAVLANETVRLCVFTVHGPEMREVAKQGTKPGEWSWPPMVK